MVRALSAKDVADLEYLYGVLPAALARAAESLGKDAGIDETRLGTKLLERSQETIAIRRRINEILQILEQ